MTWSSPHRKTIHEQMGLALMPDKKIPDTTTNPRLLTGIPFTLCQGVPYACPLEPVQNPGHPHKFEWLRQLSPPPQGEARSGGGLGLGWGWAIFSINRNPAFPIVCCPHPSPLSYVASNACRCASCTSPTGTSIARVARDGAYWLFSRLSVPYASIQKMRFLKILNGLL